VFLFLFSFLFIYFCSAKPKAKAPTTGPRRVDLGDVGAPNADRIEAWVVDEVLTADECSHYIDQAERVGLASLETVFPQAYRSSDRLLTLAPPHIVRGLFARLLPALDRRGTPRLAQPLFLIQIW
jgi:hypothetical protein